jgi:hypothetical protein
MVIDCPLFAQLLSLCSWPIDEFDAEFLFGPRALDGASPTNPAQAVGQDRQAKALPRKFRYRAAIMTGRTTGAGLVVPTMACILRVSFLKWLKYS